MVLGGEPCARAGTAGNVPVNFVDMARGMRGDRCQVKSEWTASIWAVGCGLRIRGFGESTGGGQGISSGRIGYAENVVWTLTLDAVLSRPRLIIAA